MNKMKTFTVDSGGTGSQGRIGHKGQINNLDRKKEETVQRKR